MRSWASLRTLNQLKQVEEASADVCIALFTLSQEFALVVNVTQYRLL